MGDVELLQQLAGAIVVAGGAERFTAESARHLAREVWEEIRAMGAYAYPNLVQRDDLRFVCQWDESPPLLTVMVWDEGMWRDIAQIEVVEP